MDIIEICKQPINTIWYDAKTFLFVFDENEKQIADYDFSSGLKLLTDGENITIFIYDKDLVPGKWIFVGTQLIQKNDNKIEKKIKIEGYKEGKYLTTEYNPKNIWNDPKYEINDKTVIKSENTSRKNTEEQNQFEKELDEYLKGL